MFRYSGAGSAGNFSFQVLQMQSHIQTPTKSEKAFEESM